MVVQSRVLCNQKSHWQFSDNRFYLHLHAGPKREDEKILKDTMRDVIATCDLSPLA